MVPSARFAYMARYAYIDESGMASYNNRSPYFVSAAVLIHESLYGEVESAVDELKKWVPKPQRETFRFHAYHLRTGRGDFEDWHEKIRFQVLLAHAKVIADFKIPIVYGCIDKHAMKKKYRYPFDPHVMSFVQCGRGIELTMRRDFGAERWIPVVGESDGKRQAAIREVFHESRENRSPYGFGTQTKWRHATDFVHFIPAHSSRFFALADLSAFTIAGHHWKKPDIGLHDQIKGCVEWAEKFPR